MGGPRAPATPASLEAVTRERAEVLARDAASSRGKLDSHELQEIAQLAKLVEIREKLRERPRPKRWHVAFLFFVTLALVSGLLFARVPATAIVVEARVSAVSFSLREQQALFHGLRLESLAAQNVQAIALPPPTRAEEAVDGFGDAVFDDVVMLAVRPSLEALIDEAAPRPAGGLPASEPAQGSLDVQRLILPKDTRVDFVHMTGGALVYQMALAAPDPSDMSLDVSAFGPLTLATLNSRSETTFEWVEEIQLKPLADGPNAGTLFLELVPLADAELEIASPLSIEHVSFFRTVDISESEQGIVLVPELSTVLSATIHLESLGGRQVELESGQWLEFEQISGELLSLSVHEDHIAMRLIATVTGMTTGFEASPERLLDPPLRWIEPMLAGQGRSLMPTWLEWLRAHQGMLLLWSTTTYLFGLALVLRRWWAA